MPFTVHADFNVIDGTDSNIKSVYIRSTTQILGADGVIFEDGSVRLEGGVLTVELPSPDDVGVEPDDFGFVITRAVGRTRKWQVPAQSAGTSVDLTDFTSTTSLPLVLTEYQELDGRVGDLADAVTTEAVARVAGDASKADLVDDVVPDEQLPARLSSASLSAAIDAGVADALPDSPADGQLMGWNATAGEWVPVSPSGTAEIAYAENNTATVTTIGGAGVAVDIPNASVVVPAGTRPIYLTAQCLFKNNSGGTGSSTSRALLLITEVSNGVDTPIQYAGYATMAGAGTSQWITAHVVPRRLGVPARTRTFKLQALANIAVTVDNGAVGGAAGAGSSWLAAEAR